MVRASSGKDEDNEVEENLESQSESVPDESESDSEYFESDSLESLLIKQGDRCSYRLRLQVASSSRHSCHEVFVDHVVDTRVTQTYSLTDINSDCTVMNLKRGSHGPRPCQSYEH